MEIGKTWTFETPESAEAFDAHVRTQLPFYDIATDLVADIAAHFVPRGGLVYDLGAATGNMSRAIASRLEEGHATFHSIECSEPMTRLWSGPGELHHVDLTDCSLDPYNVAVSFLCLQFIAPHLRPGVLEMLMDSRRPGGALIVLERMQNPGGTSGLAIARATLAAKSRLGSSFEDIARKELSLPGVQFPLAESELLQAWEQELIPFFRYGDFAGYVLT